jgi:hypothetical protein
LPRVVPLEGPRKGGRTAVVALSPEVADQAAGRGVGEPELGGDLAGGPMVDEIGAEDLVPPVEGVGGLEEEALVAMVVHEAASQLG